MLETIVGSSNFLSAGIVFALFLTGYLLIYLFFRNSKSSDPRADEKSLAEAREIIKKAQEEALSIVAKSTQEAASILTDTNKVKEQIDKISRISVEHATDRYLNLLQDEARELFSSYKSLFVDTVERYLKDAEKTLGDVKTNSRSYLTGRIDKEFEAVKKEIEAFKEVQIQKINDRVEEIAQSMAKEVLTKSLRPQDHRELVIQALEEAKKDGIFETL